jgi:hypothetical protein
MIDTTTLVFINKVYATTSRFIKKAYDGVEYVGIGVYPAISPFVSVYERR